MREYRLIDADSHTLEPPHIWTSWLPKKFHDRAPKLVKDSEGGDAWQFQPGTPPMEIGLVTTPGRSYEEIKWTGYTYDTIRKSCFEPKARLEDMTFDGVDACFLYPSQRTMFFFMGNQDREFHLAGVQAYNNWLAQEFCSVDPERLFGLAQMPNLGVQSMIDEIALQAARLPRRDHLDLALGRGRSLPEGRAFFCGGARARHAGLDPHPDPAQAQPAGRAHGRRVDQQHGAGRHAALPADHERAHHVRALRPLPAAARARRRDRGGLDPRGARAARQLLLAQPHPHRPEAPAPAQRVLPRELSAAPSSRTRSA